MSKKIEDAKQDRCEAPYVSIGLGGRQQDIPWTEWVKHKRSIVDTNTGGGRWTIILILIVFLPSQQFFNHNTIPSRPKRVLSCCRG